MRKWFFPVFWFPVLFLSLLQMSAFAAVEVRVGLSPFPPYIEERPDGTNYGMAVDLMEILNAFQREYRFVGVRISSMGRFKAFEEGKYDLSFFDHLRWGWETYPVEATRVYLHGGEKFVALAKPGRGQEYFDGLQGKRMAGFLGYHYRVAGFNNDPKYLLSGLGMEVSSTHEGNLLKVVRDRADVAIVTDAYIGHWMLRHPKYEGKLLVSDAWDQEYNFVMIVRKGVRPTAQELNALLDALEKAGKLEPLWRKYGVDGVGKP